MALNHNLLPQNYALAFIQWVKCVYCFFGHHLYPKWSKSQAYIWGYRGRRTYGECRNYLITYDFWYMFRGSRLWVQDTGCKTVEWWSTNPPLKLSGDRDLWKMFPASAGVKVKKGEDFNHRNILNISRIGIWACRRNWSDKRRLRKGAFCKGLGSSTVPRDQDFYFRLISARTKTRIFYSDQGRQKF